MIQYFFSALGYLFVCIPAQMELAVAPLCRRVSDLGKPYRMLRSFRYGGINGDRRTLLRPPRT